MARQRPARRKRRTREHVIADLSANYVERPVLLCGYTFDRVTHDYGVDSWIVTYNRRGEIESGEIRVQLKATDRLRAVDGGRFIALRVERGDVEYWLEQVMPVILIL